MKVKDMEPVLQEMIKRKYNVSSEHFHISEEQYLIEIDWTKCTNEERLAECRRRYKEASKIISLMDKSEMIIRTLFETWSKESIIDRNGTFLFKDGKFAEIVTEEKDKYTFKEGDRPKWTKEMIEALPHGTVLDDCSGRKVKYNGGLIKLSDYGGLYTDDVYFYMQTKQTFAEIISLPKEETMTKEQIRTELINELIGWANENLEGLTANFVREKLKSMLPTQTPEKID